MKPPASPAGRPARWHAAHRRWQATHKRWRHRLQWRLVTVFLLLALATTAVFLVGMQRALTSGWQGYAKPMVADYVDRLAAQIGSPPDVAQAQALVAHLPITVRIDGPQVHYDSHPQQRDRRRWNRDRADDVEGKGGDFGAADWGLVRTTADGHRIAFGLAAPPPSDHPRIMGWVTLAALLLLTAAAYVYVRKLLRPLQQIGAGAARFGSGDFSQPIAVQRRDELGDLTERINAMAHSLHGMLDAKRALLLAISHELRSPLTRARVNAELVDEGPHRDALLHDLGEMRDLITDLLESERLANGHAALQTELVNPAALLQEVLATHFADASLTLQIDASIGPLPLDPTRVRMLLRNLVDNALRHSAGAAQPPVVTLAREGDDLQVRVRDFGPGVSDAQLQRLAEPFYRADSARQRATGGVGLGLTLCRLVAQAHGGTLQFAHAQPGLVATARWPAPVQPPG